MKRPLETILCCVTARLAQFWQCFIHKPFIMAPRTGKRNLSEAQRALILDKRLNQKNSYVDIAKEVGCSHSTCIYVVKRYMATGSLLDAPKTGRPRVTTTRDDRTIVQMSEKDRKLTAVDIKKQFKVRNVSISTVQRRLSDHGLFGRIGRNKQFINDAHRKARLAYAIEHKDWTIADWSKVVFSDESMFNRFGSDGPVYVRRRSGEEFDPRCLKPKMQNRGVRQMVWGCFSINGVGPLHQIRGMVNGAYYRGIIQDTLLPWVQEDMPLNRRLDWILLQDNARPHTAHTPNNDTLGMFRRENVRLINHPASSPDLNPIENLWSIVKGRMRGLNPTTAQFYTEIEKAWNAIDPAVCVKLVESMPRRMDAVIKAKGMQTKY